MANFLEEYFVEDTFYGFENGLATIYGISTVSGGWSADRILLALLKGKILTYTLKTNGKSQTKPGFCEIIFKSIPLDSTVVSIDCSKVNNILTTAVTFSKDSNGRQVYYLTIFSNHISDLLNSWKSDLDSTPLDCISMELEFLPYQLTHCTVKQSIVYLLLGGDCRVHIYSQEKDEGEYSEKPVKDFFPELDSIASVPLWIDIKVTTTGKKRISAIGMASGCVFLHVTDLTTEELKCTTHCILNDSQVTSLQLFSKHSNFDAPDFLHQRYNFKANAAVDDNYHLLVTCAREPAMLYCFCDDQGFQAPILLEQSSKHDCVTCCATADVNRDGKNDVVIGTYGQEILVYRFDASALTVSAEQNPNCVSVISPIGTKSFCFPVVGVKFLDLSEDGLAELVVVTTKGVNVLRCDTKAAAHESARRLAWLEKFGKR